MNNQLPAPRPSASDPVDVSIGIAIRLRRKTRGLSQAALAEAIGVTFQQVQKYERGANRVSASSLSRVAVALGCTVGDLFIGVRGGPSLGDDDPDGFGAIGREFLSAEFGLELARAFLALAPEYRRALLSAARAFRQN